MDKILYKKFFELENEHWWFRARTHIILEILSRYIKFDLNRNFKALDIGCGTGIIVKEISDKFRINIIGVDSSDKAVKFCRKRGIRVEKGQAEKTKQLVSSFDLVTALDLVEHTEKDELVLKEFNRILKTDGYLLLTVPAFNFLWDYHDNLNHHKRRYSITELKNKMQAAGFKIVKISYYNTLLFPVVILVKLFKKMLRSKSADLEKTNFIANCLLYKIFSGESLLLKYINFPVGVSLICLAQKSK